MYFMAQKRTPEGKRFAFLQAENIPEDADYEESLKDVYPLMWKQWQENPEKWAKGRPGEVTKPVDNAYERPWDFAIFVIDRLPVGQEVNIKILESSYYFTH